RSCRPRPDAGLHPNNVDDWLPIFDVIGARVRVPIDIGDPDVLEEPSVGEPPGPTLGRAARSGQWIEVEEERIGVDRLLARLDEIQIKVIVQVGDPVPSRGHGAYAVVGTGAGRGGTVGDWNLSKGGRVPGVT